MRKLTFRGILATLVVAAVVPFIGSSVRGSMPFVHDPRGMAGVGIAGWLLTFAALGREALGTGAFEWFMVTLGVLTLGFGIAALIAETTWALLVPMVAGLVIIWLLPCCMTSATSRRHTRSGTPDAVARRGRSCRALPGGLAPLPVTRGRAGCLVTARGPGSCSGPGHGSS